MNDNDIDATRERERVILPGPWRVGKPTPTGPDLWELPILLDRAGPDGPQTIQVCAVEYQTGGFHYPHADAKADAEFIARARTDVPALLAKVDELTAKIERRRLRLVEAEADLLNVRGILSPNGYPQRVPVDLVPTVAPAVQWLADRVDELTAALAERDTQLTQSRTQATTYANKIGNLTAENARLRQQRDGLIADLTDAGNDVDLLTAANNRFADQLTEAGKHPCNCCFNDGSTIRCGRPATQVIDVPPFGALDVADTCAERINGKPAEATR